MYRKEGWWCVLHFHSEGDNPCSKWSRRRGPGVFYGACVSQIRCGLWNKKENSILNAASSSIEMLRQWNSKMKYAVVLSPFSVGTTTLAHHSYMFLIFSDLSVVPNKGSLPRTALIRCLFFCQSVHPLIQLQISALRTTFNHLKPNSNYIYLLLYIL